MMDFNKYQNDAKRTSRNIIVNHAIAYPALGLADEAGEVAGKIKKIFRDKDGIIGPEDRDALKYELGDVLWYIAEMATVLGFDMEEIAEANIAKLADRQRRNAIGGDGDNR